MPFCARALRAEPVLRNHAAIGRPVRLLNEIREDVADRHAVICPDLENHRSGEGFVELGPIQNPESRDSADSIAVLRRKYRFFTGDTDFCRLESSFGMPLLQG